MKHDGPPSDIVSMGSSASVLRTEGRAQSRTFSSLRSFRWRGTSSILACHRPLPGRASSGSQPSPCASKVRWVPDCRNRKVFDGNSALRSGSGSISLDRKASACGPAPMTWQTCGSQQRSSQWGQRQSTTSSSASTSLMLGSSHRAGRGEYVGTRQGLLIFINFLNFLKSYTFTLNDPECTLNGL